MECYYEFHKIIVSEHLQIWSVKAFACQSRKPPLANSLRLQQTTNSNNILSKFISSGKVGIGRRIQSQSLDLIPHQDHAQLHEHQKHQHYNQQKRGIRESLRRVLSSLIAGIASPSLLAIAVRLARLRVELALASHGTQSAVHSALRGAAVDRVERQVVRAAVLRHSLLVRNVVLLLPAVQLDLEGHGSAVLLLSVDVAVHNAHGWVLRVHQAPAHVLLRNILSQTDTVAALVQKLVCGIMDRILTSITIAGNTIIL